MSCSNQGEKGLNICARARLFTDWDNERFGLQGATTSGTFSFNADTAVLDSLRALSKGLDAGFFSAAVGSDSASFTLSPKKER